MTVDDPALAAALRAHGRVDAALGQSVSVDFGPVLSPTSSLESVAIASSTEDAAAVSGQSEPDGPRRQRDTWEIGCMAQVVSDVVSIADAQALLTRAYGLMGQVGALLVGADPEAPGTTWEGVVRHQATFVKTKAGPGALVSFYIAGSSSRVMTTR